MGCEALAAAELRRNGGCGSCLGGDGDQRHVVLRDPFALDALPDLHGDLSELPVDEPLDKRQPLQGPEPVGQDPCIGRTGAGQGAVRGSREARPLVISGEAASGACGADGGQRGLLLPWLERRRGGGGGCPHDVRREELGRDTSSSTTTTRRRSRRRSRRRRRIRAISSPTRLTSCSHMKRRRRRKAAPRDAREEAAATW